MAKIDTSKIPGYAEMSADDKLAALEAYDYEDYSSEVDRLKAANSKASSEAAEWKRKHNALLSEDEKKKQEDADRYAAMEAELNELRKGKLVSEFTAQFVAQGYSAELAAATAQALADGDTATLFANSAKFLNEHDKQVKAENLKKTPRPPVGEGSEDADYQTALADAQSRGDYTSVAYYTRLIAERQEK